MVRRGRLVSSRNFKGLERPGVQVSLRVTFLVENRLPGSPCKREKSLFPASTFRRSAGQAPNLSVERR